MRWFLQNVRYRTAFAIRNPRYTLSALIRELILADERFLAKITDSSPCRIRSYLDEPIRTPRFADVLRRAEQQFRDALQYTRQSLDREMRIRGR